MITVVPLLDDDNTPHSANMAVKIDTDNLRASLLQNGKLILTMKLRKDSRGMYFPSDPMSARSPQSAFEHTVNVWCNKYNAKIKNAPKVN